MLYLGLALRDHPMHKSEHDKPVRGVQATNTKAKRN